MNVFKRGDLITFNAAFAYQGQQWFYCLNEQTRDLNQATLRSAMVGLVGEVIAVDCYNYLTIWWPQLPGYNKEKGSCFIHYPKLNFL